MTDPTTRAEEGANAAWDRAADFVRLRASLDAAESRAASAEAEVERLKAALVLSRIAFSSLSDRMAAAEGASVRNPLTGKPAPVWLVLSDLAAQENCDGEPYDTMQAASEVLRAVLKGEH